MNMHLFSSSLDLLPQRAFTHEQEYDVPIFLQGSFEHLEQKLMVLHWSEASHMPQYYTAW
jgi:hypothetical protein